ncbi:tetratricopeptide repeat protein [Candidatus Neomarinimicrobiota bacterium]
MGKIGHTFIVYSLIMGGFLSADIGQEDIYQRGLEAYQNEQWSLAIQEFESILRSGYESEVLYYNLGNAYYRAGHVAGAVWAYEQALSLNPNDADARYNLALANLRVQDRIDLPEMPLYVRLYKAVRESLTPSEWIQRVSVVLFLVALAFALSRILQKTWLGWAVIPGIVVAMLLFSIAIDSITITSRTREGIIYNQIVTAYSAPSARATRLFELHEGLKVSISEQNDEWYQIELLDGKTGWIPMDNLRQL